MSQSPSGPQDPQQTPTALDPLTIPATDDIASDLPMLVERNERVRKFFFAEREYIKLILMGGAFILAGAMASPDMPRRTLIVLTFAATPWLYGWFNLPIRRLWNSFRNETMPFLLRDFGRWNYAFDGTHFPREALKKTGLITPTDLVAITDILTGERLGVPLQVAQIVTGTPARFGFYRPPVPTFQGFGGSVRLADLPTQHVLLMPNVLSEGVRRRLVGWTSKPAGIEGFSLWLPAGAVAAFPESLLTKLEALLAEAPHARFALYNGVLWFLIPSEDAQPFGRITSVSERLDDAVRYQKIRNSLASMFGLIDKIVC